MKLRYTLIALVGFLPGCLLSGCSLLPQRVEHPSVRNPFPQLSRVAILPFFNHSAEPTLDGRQVAIAYYNELQLVPGFEVVPVNTVQRTMEAANIELNGPDDVRRLGKLLGVDAVLVGLVTDYSPHYPPHMSLKTEWFAVNPGFHPIPPGYGLPWGTTEEREIPLALVNESEFALAKEQLATQTPPLPPEKAARSGAAKAKPADRTVSQSKQADPSRSGADDTTAPGVAGDPGSQGEAAPAAQWPDPRGFIPPLPHPQPCFGPPNDAPVIVHTRTYNGHDSDFTSALASYYALRDDGRFDGWQGYLQRSDDFIRFCCHMHVWETLTARGGAGESRVVWKWPTIR